jgi:hypothetical protein
MQNYFIRPGGAYIKIDSETKLIDLILNTETQKTVSNMNDINYYNTTVSASVEWPTTDQTTFDTNRTEVLNYLTGSI